MTMATLIPEQSDFAAGASVAPRGTGDYLALEEGLRARLDELGGLDSGWDGESARSIDALALRVAWSVVEQALRAHLPEPEVFPVPDGGVQLEWSAGPVELELEIEPNGSAVVFVCDDEQAGQRIDGELPGDESRFGLALARLNAYA